MATTIENTLNKIGDVIQDIFHGPKDTPMEAKIVNSKKQSNLEKIGMGMRTLHMHRNEWRREEQYTKPLVSSEYVIQTEFLVN